MCGRCHVSGYFPGHVQDWVKDLLFYSSGVASAVGGEAFNKLKKKLRGREDDRCVGDVM